MIRAKFKGYISIKLKIFVLSMLVTTLSLLFSSQLMIRRAANVIVDNTYAYIHESMEYANANLDALINDVIGIGVTLASSERNTLQTLNRAEPIASYHAFEQQLAMETFIRGLVIDKDYISSAAIIGRDGRSYQIGGSIIKREIIDEPWYQSVVNESRLKIFYNQPETNHVLVSRPIYYDGEVIGCVAVELDANVLNSVYNINYLQQVHIITLDEEKQIVFSNSADQSLTENINGLDSFISSNEISDKEMYHINGEDVLAIVYESPVNRLRTVGIISYDSIMTEALSIRTQMLSILIAAFVGAAFISWFLAIGVSRNLRKLQTTMQTVTEGELTVRADVDSNDEIGILGNIFNIMMDRIENLIHENVMKEAGKREAELRVLETQIQPHFIYNILNSITFVAHLRQEKEIEDVSAATVALMRGVLSVRESFIPLWQEYQYIEQYVTIQEFKSQRRIVIVWDVAEDLWECKIPKLIIQPIIENSILHGISHKENGRISVQIFGDLKMLYIRITDNGKGMSLEEIDNLYVVSLSEEHEPRMRGFGFRNVHERIQMTYGDQYGATVNSFKGAFTTVELTLPYEKVLYD